MINVFDKMAPVYDKEFSETDIGILQRNIVHAYLKKNFSIPGMNILELNCGTGIDAQFLASMGHQVLATDSSEEMINMARRKRNLPAIDFELLSIEELSDDRVPGKFDLIFSNFGGLNCLSPEDLNTLQFKLHKLMNENGSLVFVLMSNNCLWEQFYYLAKWDREKALRRRKNAGIEFIYSGAKQKVWYYSPSFFNSWKERFRVIAAKPVGFTIPPAYLHSYFQKHPNQLTILKKAEEIISPFSFFARFSDHFLIHLSKKNG